MPAEKKNNNQVYGQSGLSQQQLIPRALILFLCTNEAFREKNLSLISTLPPKSFFKTFFDNLAFSICQEEILPFLYYE